MKPCINDETFNENEKLNFNIRVLVSFNWQKWLAPLIEERNKQTFHEMGFCFHKAVWLEKTPDTCGDFYKLLVKMVRSFERRVAH